jgi:hypothetical protein
MTKEEKIGYCMRCRKKVQMKDISVEDGKVKGTLMYRGKCPECNSTVCLFGKKK